MPRYRHLIELTAGGESFPVKSGRLSLDDSRIPYMRADVEIAAEGILDTSPLAPTAGLNNCEFTLTRVDDDNPGAAVAHEFVMHSRRTELSLDRTIRADFASIELLLRDLHNPYISAFVTSPGNVASYTVGNVLNYLFGTFFTTTLRTKETFALSGSVPSMPIELADGATDLEMPEGVNFLEWLDPHMARYDKVLRSNEAGQLIIADRGGTATLTLQQARAGVNMVGYSEELDRDSDIFADAVSVHFQPNAGAWVSVYPELDQPGAEASKMQYVDRTSLPSPINQFTTNPELIAQGIQQRNLLRRKSMNVRLLSDYAWRPGHIVEITSPFGQDYTGICQAVEWEFPAGEMNVTLRNVELVP